MNTVLASTIQRMGFEPCLVPEEPPKRERNLPVLITRGSRRERPGISQHFAPGFDKVGHFAAGVGFRHSIERRHDAPPLDQAGALLSSPIVAGCGAVMTNHGSVQFRASGQFCSHIKIAMQKEPAPARGKGWGRQFHRMPGGTVHPVARHQVTPAKLVPGQRRCDYHLVAAAWVIRKRCVGRRGTSEKISNRSPSTTPASATSDKPYEEQQDDSTNRCVDDCVDDTGAEMNTQPW